MATSQSPLEQTLWEQWLHEKNRDAANQLVQNYMYLVNYHVERIAVHLPATVQKDDLYSYGLVGLFDALNKFDINRDLKFDTYASFRIRGAIMDGLRKEDWLPRSIREKTKQIETASEELEQRYQRPPTSAEIAKKLGMTEKEVESHIKDSLFAHLLSIEDKPKDQSGSHKEGIGYTIPDDASIQPDVFVQKKELKEELAAGIKQLNDNEQLVISLFYHEELTLTEIGHILNLTTSRISQIHRKAIFKLRQTLQKLQS
ncbi:MAG TPA: FliA/WhiG family RNA polymerase sigma factor [Bacillota bacterium]|nr:FliA/WhiG family RNA polymerase sigma factor [Bacillota bacterium]